MSVIRSCQNSSEQVMETDWETVLPMNVQMDSAMP
jgi:hypothetical protein